MPSDGSRATPRREPAKSNVLAGSRYLREMIARFGSTNLALAAYNAGPGAVERAGGAPATETLSYVANVNRLLAESPGLRLNLP